MYTCVTLRYVEVFLGFAPSSVGEVQSSYVLISKGKALLVCRT